MIVQKQYLMYLIIWVSLMSDITSQAVSLMPERIRFTEGKKRNWAYRDKKIINYGGKT